MKKATCIALLINAIYNTSYADDSVYCPQKSGFAHVGMTTAQLIQSCGEPQIKQTSNRSATRKIPVQQLFFQNHGGTTAFYGQYAIPGGYRNDGDLVPFGSSSSGQMLEIDIVGDKVAVIKLNGGTLNSLSTCDSPIQVGDDVSDALFACGSPTKENDTYVNLPIQSQQLPEIWIYQADEYHPPIRMTVVDDKIYSIE